MSQSLCHVLIPYTIRHSPGCIATRRWNLFTYTSWVCGFSRQSGVTRSRAPHVAYARIVRDYESAVYKSHVGDM